MADVKHTPGPWQVKQSNNEIVNTDHGLLPFAITAGYTLIGALYENEADARLIAAAPDLLEALQSFVDHGTCFDDNDLSRARAAIAKATASAPECTCPAKDMPFGRCCKATGAARATEGSV